MIMVDSYYSVFIVHHRLFRSVCIIRSIECAANRMRCEFIWIVHAACNGNAACDAALRFNALKSIYRFINESPESHTLSIADNHLPLCTSRHLYTRPPSCEFQARTDAYLLIDKPNCPNGHKFPLKNPARSNY
jgi:hypothetical protein